jgi:class 3 adenylate cyclase/tetratricopeptide (TPR) repeat protein
VAIGPGTLSAPAVQTTEHRLVSVLFADLVGFTTLAESRDSEEVRDLLSRYFDACREVISRYGGTVEKFIGDAVMAVWGAPVAQEDDAERAVRTAIDLVQTVADLGEEVGAPELSARAGVLTGEATVNLGVTGQGMVAGDLVNTASRIQSVADPGTVLVGEATRRASEAAVAYADAGEHELKGKSEPVRLWQAMRVTAGRGGLMRSEGLESPFVGREREMKLVKDLFHSSADERRATLVQVTGIAGIGKSRLAWEFFKYMDGLDRLYFWHRGRCLAYGEGVTYWALAEMVRGRAGILEAEDRASVARKLHETVERYVTDPDDRRFVEPRLAHLIGLAERTAPDKHDLFAGWRLFFERLTEADPVLMVFEDLQWADPSLLEFLDYLLEWSRNFPIFVLTLARPEAEGAPLVAARRNATSIYLDPLPPGAMQQLLTGLVPGLPAETTQQILDRAEGVPLYAVETVRMLLDRGLLVQDGPVYRPAGEITSLEVPETLHALIAARLDGLSAEERALVQDTSVLGRTFTKEAAVALSNLGRTVESLLASLVAKEVLGIQADPRSPERGQYGFLQDLVRTVAYETLSKKDRRTRHLQAAAYLEQAWGEGEEEIVEVVADHLLQAYRLAPEDEEAEQIKTRARQMLTRAAERAASLAAGEEAQGYFAQAAELTDSTLERAELTERAGEMAELRGHPEEASAAYERASALFEESGQSGAAARAQARLAGVDFMRGQLEQAVERMQAAHSALAGQEPNPDQAMVAAQLGRFHAIAGRYEKAAPLLEEALSLAEHLQLPEVYSQALSSKAIALMNHGRPDEAGLLLRGALEVALENDLVAAASRAYNNLAFVFELLDRFADAVQGSQQLLELSRRVGDRSNELVSLIGTIMDLVNLGRWDEALDWANEARAAEELSSLEWAAYQLLELIPLYVRRGELTEAEEVLQELSGAAAAEDLQYRVGYALVRSELLRAQGAVADALAAAEEVMAAREQHGLANQIVKRGLVQAVEAALSLGDVGRAEELLGIVETALPGEVTPWLKAQAARLAARVAIVRGRDEDVEPAFIAAEDGFRELGSVFDLAVTRLEHAEWLSGHGRSAEAGPLLAEARETFEHLRARPWVERLERAGAGTEVPA